MIRLQREVCWGLELRKESFFACKHSKTIAAMAVAAAVTFGLYSCIAIAILSFCLHQCMVGAVKQMLLLSLADVSSVCMG